MVLQQTLFSNDLIRDVSGWAQDILRDADALPPDERLRVLLHVNREQERLASIPATPEGYGYERYEAPHERRALGKTLFVAPHPSDASADFYPLLIGKILEMGGECTQVLLTRGEKGHTPFSEESTIALRELEERASSLIAGLGGDVPYLQDAYGKSFPDGQLLDHLIPLIDALEAHVVREQPQTLCIPSLYPDHPDHVAAAVAALEVARRHPELEVVTSDPEFGVSLGQPYGIAAVTAFLERGGPGADILRSYIESRHYRFTHDAQGFVGPVTDETKEGFRFDHPFAVAPFVLPVTHDEELVKLYALLQHGTQVDDPEKPYADNIALLDRTRGDQIPADAAWGMALYPLTERHTLIDALPEVYRLRLLAENQPEIRR